MPELTIFKAVLRARDGGIYGLHVAQDFYFMRAPKLFVSITNRHAKMPSKRRRAATQKCSSIPIATAFT